MRPSRAVVIAALALVVGAAITGWLFTLTPAAEAGPGASNWEAYTALLRNVPHWYFELTLEAITGFLVYPFARWFWNKWHREHDEEHHTLPEIPVLDERPFKPGDQIQIGTGADSKVFTVRYTTPGRITLEDISPGTSIEDRHPVG